MLSELKETQCLPWNKASLGDAAHDYWWRDSIGSDAAIEISMDTPDEAWRVGLLPSGRPYLWRPSADPDDPEIRLWNVGVLESGAQYWWTDEGAVSLTDPHDLAQGYEEL